MDYILSDDLGLTTVVADSGGNEVGYVYYDPYGQVLTSTLPAGLTDRLFTGQRLEATGLYDYRARMYDPVTGSFIQPDSFLGGVAGFNRYGYVGGNPVNYTDPTGHFGCPAPWDCLDIIDFGASLNGFIADPTLGNLGWLTLSTVGLLPIIPGLGMVRRAGKLGTVDNVAKTIDILPTSANGFRGLADYPTGFPNRVAGERFSVSPKGKFLDELTIDARKNRGVLYVITKKGEIRVTLTDAGGRTYKGRRIHHSYLVNGENVYGAGEISFDAAGQIKDINALSGHYSTSVWDRKLFGPQFREYMQKILTERYGFQIDNPRQIFDQTMYPPWP